ncbi:DUF3427 domain-containing protein [Mangrovihabitans endophyticus]|uniref:Helicase n=1 Tax=Mangrovihabitans endophyticus TaxID=1751298 RepID=A0A8J3C3V0_9ACTN|nr:DEAD/DEAH box helicase [Mangrovihabitans endophyticus]GGL05865.1 helicase [Mangrovihabitans endophyticus]
MTELPAGAYEHLITERRESQLARLDAALVDRANLDSADSHEMLARHVATVARRALRAVKGTDHDKLERQIALANRIVAMLYDDADPDDVVSTRDKPLLRAVADRPAAPAKPAFPVRPEVPFGTGVLLTNGRGQPRIGTEVAREMASADEVDLLCAFIKWHGIRVIEEALAELRSRGGRLRIITTTYMGATEQRALDRLASLGAEIRVSYETRTTRLHAKAWLFRRHSGTHTAYVGSSNLSKSALIDGLEWNVRLSQLEQASLLDHFAATFDEYWTDPAFEPYDPAHDGVRLHDALLHESGMSDATLPLSISALEVRPYGYQQEILERLDAERTVHRRHRNLVVMATGTGKTIVAALDYRRLRRSGAARTLLFVAHQDHILDQAIAVFRQVLDMPIFGEKFGGGSRPARWDAVFASIQSLHRLNLDEVEPTMFDMVIVDEFHHAEAPTYAKILQHLTPRIMLGLTATPERTDGGDIRRWFDGHTAIELRLWEALERQLLAPFQYFGIADNTDLSHLGWKRGHGYDRAELGRVYTGHHARARLVVKAVADTADANTMRAIGFCVSIGHAEFMAAQFAKAGIPSVALHSRIDRAAQRDAVRRLKEGTLRAIFTVDLFNEGVDIPSVDTIMLLRPTESATIFLQQLGRGLRLADGKPCLTVLDFIGTQHANFRFDLRYRALTGATRRKLERDVHHDFPTLPAGCAIKLDRVSKQTVLANIRSALRIGRHDLAQELREHPELTLAAFLDETGLELEDLYRSKSIGGWTGLRRQAGLTAPATADDARMASAIARMLHIDDLERLEHLGRIGDGSWPDGRLGYMLDYSVDNRAAEIASDADRRRELREIVELLKTRVSRVTHRLDRSGAIPLHVHARYTRNEALAAFGVAKPESKVAGVQWAKAENADIFLVTLEKTEEHFSPTTMYQDRALSPDRFQWESQTATSTRSAVGQRYVNHERLRSSVHLFLRKTKIPDGALGAPPYLYAGPMTYLRHSGDRPMRIEWQLEYPLPADVFHAARVVAG